MIDIENIVLTNVSNAVQAVYSGCSVESDNVDIPKSFPCVTVCEADNKSYTNSQDNYETENHAELMYELNVYTAGGTGKKPMAKAIAEIVDSTMNSMKFTRTFKNAIPNTDRTIYRITMRYTGVVEAGITSGTNTTHQMYRR